MQCQGIARFTQSRQRLTARLLEIQVADLLPIMWVLGSRSNHLLEISSCHSSDLLKYAWIVQKIGPRLRDSGNIYKPRENHLASSQNTHELARVRLECKLTHVVGDQIVLNVL